MDPRGELCEGSTGRWVRAGAVLVLFRYFDAARRNPREELQDKYDLASVREAFLIKEHTDGDEEWVLQA